MRKLIALVFHYSLNGLLADEGTEYYRFCSRCSTRLVARARMTSPSTSFRARMRTSWAAPPTRAWPRTFRRTLTTRGPRS